LLFLTDGVAYMKKAGEVLKQTYPTLIHLTCVVHGFHLVAEEIRSHYPEVDKMIGAIKAVFRKAPSRIRKYKEMFPEGTLPPSPVYTRWGTWLEAVEYYASNFDNIRDVVNYFDSKKAKCIDVAQTLMSNKDIVSQLSYISANFTFLTRVLKQLQEDNVSLSNMLAIVTESEEKLKNVNGDVGKAIYVKLRKVHQKNKDLAKIKIISNIIDGNHQSTEKINLGASQIAAFKFAPITTTSTERSFSMNKALLTDRRQNFTMKNVEMCIVSHFALSD